MNRRKLLSLLPASIFGFSLAARAQTAPASPPALFNGINEDFLRDLAKAQSIINRTNDIVMDKVNSQIEPTGPMFDPNVFDRDGILFRIFAEGRQFAVYANGEARGWTGKMVGICNYWPRLREQALADYEKANGIEWAVTECKAVWLPVGGTANPARRLLASTNDPRFENAPRDSSRTTVPCGAKFRHIVGAAVNCPRCGSRQVEASPASGIEV